MNSPNRNILGPMLDEVANDNDVDPARPMTCREIAARLGISKSRVEQIEKQALRKLRRAALLHM